MSNRKKQRPKKPYLQLPRGSSSTDPREEFGVESNPKTIPKAQSTTNLQLGSGLKEDAIAPAPVGQITSGPQSLLDGLTPLILPEEAKAELKLQFTTVERAVLGQPFLMLEVQQLLSSLSRKQISGEDTREGNGRLFCTGTFRGFTFTNPDNGETTTTKFYQNGNIATTLADGREIRFPPISARTSQYAEATADGGEPEETERRLANVSIATADGDQFTVTQKADGSLIISFNQTQSDGATSMILPSENPEGIKWIRTIPQADASEEKTITAFSNGNKLLRYDEPARGTILALLSRDGSIQAAVENQPSRATTK